jgi:hypothetical protein
MFQTHHITTNPFNSSNALFLDHVGTIKRQNGELDHAISTSRALQTFVNVLLDRQQSPRLDRTIGEKVPLNPVGVTVVE